MRYSIWLVSPAGYVHARAFERVAESLRHAFFEVFGYAYSVPVERLAVSGKRNIVIGGNLINDIGGVPEGSIIYNLEQITPESEWLTDAYVALLSRHEVWDYSRRNIGVLKEMGIEAKLLEIGYEEGLHRVKYRTKDIDVLHYGSMNQRRAHVLEGLRAAGMNVHHAFGVYRDELDELIARSKVVVNIHYYEAKVWEIVRCSYLMANSKCVVSESGSDEELESPYRDGVVFVPYEGLVDACVEMVKNTAAREERGKRGYEIFSGRRQVDFLKETLGFSGKESNDRNIDCATKRILYENQPDNYADAMGMVLRIVETYMEGLDSGTCMELFLERYAKEIEAKVRAVL